MTATKTTYTLTGSVRGNCGHKHRTISGAAACSCRDQSDCRSVGGYSDRALVVIDGDEPRKPTESEYADFADCIDKIKHA